MSKPVDWAADERKLQAAYDDLSAGRLKAASATVERWLKKHARSQPALVLRMALLEKQGAGAPAVLAAYADVERTLPLSGRSMWYAALALGGVGRSDLVLDMYQRAWDARPELAELGEMVFLHAAGMGRADTMAASSRKLFNLTKLPVWARLAAYSAWYSVAPAPSTTSPFPTCPPKSLLAASLLFRTSGPPTTSSHLYLALQIAFGSADLKEAARLVSAEAYGGSLERQWLVMRAVEELDARQWKWDEDGWPWARAVALLEEGEAQRNYAFYQHLLRCLAAHLTPERTAATVRTLTTLHAEIGARERAPLLALLELGRTEPALIGDWAERAGEYWDRWGAAGGVAGELVGAAGDDAERKRAVLNLMRGAVGAPHTDVKSYLRMIQAETCLLGNDTTPTLQLARRWWDLYAAGLQYGANLLKTDLQPADPVGLTAIHILLAVWHANRADGHVLVTAAACAEHVLARSPSSQQARFLLVVIYRLLAAPSLAMSHLASLKLTEIQLDTLAFVGLDRAATEARLAGGEAEAQWRRVVEEAGAMYRRSAREMPEYTKQAFENESYSKINGIRQLVHALDRSVARRVLAVEDATYDTLRARELDDRSIAALSHGLQTDTIDSRTFELAPEVRGLPSLKTIAGHTDSSWSSAMAYLHLRVARFMQGGQADNDRPSIEALSAAEQAAFEAVERLLQGASGSSAGADMSDVFARSVELCRSARGDGRDRAEPFLVLVQLVKTAEAVLRRAAELAKPVKGKKKDATLGAFRETAGKALADVKAAKLELELGEPVVAEAFTDAVDVDVVTKVTEERAAFAAQIAGALK